MPAAGTGLGNDGVTWKFENTPSLRTPALHDDDDPADDREDRGRDHDRAIDVEPSRLGFRLRRRFDVHRLDKDAVDLNRSKRSDGSKEADRESQPSAGSHGVVLSRKP